MVIARRLRTLVPRAALRAIALAALWLHVDATTAQSDSPLASERAIKAAFLYKFTEYVAWPRLPDARQPFTIGVLGSGALAEDLLRMTANRTVDEHPIRVRRVDPDDGTDDLQVLFIAGEQRGRLTELLSPLRGRPILTVTESTGALSDGSVINFTVSGERVRFEVSLDAAQANQLRLSSRLLAVAANVQQSR